MSRSRGLDYLSLRQPCNLPRMMPHEKLEAWRACLDLYAEVHRVTSAWPKREWYGLASQLGNAALSAGSNIAEGVARKGQRELARFLNIALGSLAEVSHQLRAANAVGVLAEAEYEQLALCHQKAGRLTWRLYRSILKLLRTQKE